MRNAALVAIGLLVVGCASGCGTGAHGSGPPHSSSSVAPATPSPGGAPSGSKSPADRPGGPAPAAGAPIAAVIAWIEAGHPADPGRYHTATRDGVTAQLGTDTALRALSGKATCTTDSRDSQHNGNALLCLVELTSPPPQPETAYGMWKGGWVDFDGTRLTVGAARGDPGPFVNGSGPALVDGDSLSFADFRCRADQSGLYCVNYAHQTAVQFSAAGIVPYGCLRPVPPAEGVGTAFAC